MWCIFQHIAHSKTLHFGSKGEREMYILNWSQHVFMCLGLCYSCFYCSFQVVCPFAHCSTSIWHVLMNSKSQEALDGVSSNLVTFTWTIRWFIFEDQLVFGHKSRNSMIYLMQIYTIYRKLTWWNDEVMIFYIPEVKGQFHFDIIMFWRRLLHLFKVYIYKSGRTST